MIYLALVSSERVWNHWLFFLWRFISDGLLSCIACTRDFHENNYFKSKSLLLITVLWSFDKYWGVMTKLRFWGAIYEYRIFSFHWWMQDFYLSFVDLGFWISIYACRILTYHLWIKGLWLTDCLFVNLFPGERYLRYLQLPERGRSLGCERGTLHPCQRSRERVQRPVLPCCRDPRIGFLPNCGKLRGNRQAFVQFCTF